MSGMSTAEYDQLEEIREVLEGIRNLVSSVIFAVTLYLLFKASGVSVQWLTSS